jgi:hypothetical protein
MRILMTLVLAFSSLVLCAQKDKKLYTRIDTVWHHFEELDLSPFTDTAASYFLQQQDAPYTFKQILPPGKPGYAGMLRMIYPEGVYVDIYVRRYLYTNPNGFNQRKNIARFGREKVAAIRVHNELACLNGCD